MYYKIQNISTEDKIETAFQEDTKIFQNIMKKYKKILANSSIDKTHEYIYTVWHKWTRWKQYIKIQGILQKI